MGLIATPQGVEPNCHALAAETVTGNGPAVDFEGAREAAIMLNVTEVSGGSPTLDITIEESVDAIVWKDLASFTQKTAPVKAIMKLTAFARHLRASWVIGGTTPSFTFSLKANAKG